MENEFPLHALPQITSANVYLEILSEKQTLEIKAKV